MNKSASVAKRIVKYRYVWIALSILMVVMSVPGLKNITFDADARIFFDEKNPDRIALDKYEAEFAKDDNIGIVVVPRNGKIFSPSTLSAIKDLTKSAWQLPYVRRIDSITNYQYSYAENDDLIIRDFVEDPTSLSVQEMNDLEKVAVADVSLLHSIISPKADVSAVQVLFRLPGKDLQAETPFAVSETQLLVNEFRQKYSNLEFKLTGSVMMNQQFAISGQQDGQTLTPAMFLIFILVMGFAYRTVSGTIVGIVVIALSALCAIGIWGHMGGKLNSITALAPLIIMTLSLASVGHMLSTLRKSMGESKVKKVWSYLALKKNIVPISIAGITTMVGFLSLNYSISPPFRELGNIVAIGVFMSLFFNLFLLPSLLCILPIKYREKESFVDRQVKKYTSLIISKPALMMSIGGVMCFASIAGISKLVLEDDFVRYFDDRYELRRDMDYYESNLGGHNALEYALPAQGEGGISNVAYLKSVEKFVEWMRAQPEVTYVRSVTDTLSRLNMNMHADDNSYYRIPESQGEAAQYLFLYEMSLPYGVDLTDQINVDRTALRVTVTMAHVSTTEMRALTQRADSWLIDNAASMHVTPTGLSHVFNQISYRDVRSMLTGTVYALIAISFLLVVIFKNIQLGVISLIPNLVPAAMAFGIWGYSVGTVTLAIAVVIAMTLGIVVDDTVHFLCKYKEGKDMGKNTEDSVKYSFDQVGTAIVVTSVGFILGFIVLGFSGFAVNGDMARLTALTIAMALVADFIILPSVLILNARRKNGLMFNRNTAAPALGALLLAVVVMVPDDSVASVSAADLNDEQRGLQIIEKTDAYDTGWGDYYAEGKMILMDSNGRKTVRELESFNLERDGSVEGDWLVILFNTPADIRGTASLTHSQLEPNNDDQWLFLPASRRVKKVSSSNRAGKFVSSEFTFEDLSSQEVADYKYKFIGTEPCTEGGELTCSVIESYPINERSGYSKRVLWIDNEHFRQWKIEYYNRRGDLEKVMRSDEFNMYGEKHWRASKIHMLNVQTNKSTLLDFEEYKFGYGLTAADFSSQRFYKIK